MHQELNYDLDSNTTVSTDSSSSLDLTYGKLFKAALAVGTGFALADVTKEAIFWAGRKTGLNKTTAKLENA